MWIKKSLSSLFLGGLIISSVSVLKAQDVKIIDVGVEPAKDTLVVTEVIATQPELSLDECIRIALNNNPTIMVADLEINRMDYSKRDIIAQLLPNVAFGVNYNRMVAKQVAYMDFDMGALGGIMGGDSGDGGSESARASSGKDDGIKMGRDNSWQVGFNASVPIIAPQLWSSLDLSDSQIAQAMETSRASRLDLVNQISNAYYQLMLAIDSKEVIKESYDMAALTHDIYSKQFKFGAASEYDVLRTSVAMKNVEPELMQADIAIRRAKLQLCVLLGLPADLDFNIVGKLSDFEGTMYEETLALNRDYSKNTNLVMNTLQQETLYHSIQVAKNAFLPTLALTASYNWTSSSNGNPFTGLRWSPYSMIGLTVNFPLFQGGARVNKIRTAEIQMEQTRLNRENLERSVGMQVDLAMDNILLNVKQIASNSENVKQAERAHTIMEQSFAIGAASYLDLRDAELALTRTRLAYYQSIYNYLVARSELKLLLGSEDEIYGIDKLKK